MACGGAEPRFPRPMNGKCRSGMYGVGTIRLDIGPTTKGREKNRNPPL
jgi:hypothetical protein